MPSMLKVIQANLQHKKTASANLANKFKSEAIDVALIQEPYVVKGRVLGLGESGGRLMYDVTSETPRTCLLVNKKINALLLQEFCSRDLVTAKLRMDGINGCGEIIIGSAYCPSDSADPPPTEEVGKLVDKVKREDEHLVLGADVNAHHVAWGSTDCNARGESLLEYITRVDLDILNKGNKPTFITRVRREVLDITLCTLHVAKFITNWRVSGEPSLADHQHIQFEIVGKQCEDLQYRNPRKTNWKDFREDLGVAVQGQVAEVRRLEELEEASEHLENAVLGAYQANCPINVSKNSGKVRWWNGDLARMKREVRALFRTSSRLGCWDRYHRKLTEYNTEIRKAKRKSWRQFCERVESCSETARLQKVLKVEHRNPVGTLMKPDGRYTQSERETLEVLLNCHFPDSEKEEDEFPAGFGLRPRRADWNCAGRLVKPAYVDWAIRLFDAYRAPGPDGILPLLLKEGLEVLRPVLVGLFRASLALGHVPRRWSVARVVFIPKPGRAEYAEARAYRPICLNSFLLKTMERILDKYIRDKVNLNSALHENQFAYRPGRSTESALHQLVSRIEENLEVKEIALAAFLDIEGAFSNTSFHSMVKALEECGVSKTVVRWVSAMLNSRSILATLGSESIRVRAGRGCAQGGVLSPLLWILVVDKILRKLNAQGYYTQGYADDLVIVVRGKDLKTVTDLMQSALTLVEKWCQEEGLSVNPGKTTLVPFTRKRKLGETKLPKMFGQEIVFGDRVKYLGVLLDQRLTWNPQIQRLTTRAKSLMFACRRAVGKTWGLKPRMVMWIYTMIIRPLVSYGAVVWWTKTTQGTVGGKLNSIQRMASLAITGAMSSTPTVTLEALLDLPPLGVFIQGQARMGAYRLQQTGCWRSRWPLTGHQKISQVISGDALHMPSDHMTPRLSVDKTFKTKILPREDWGSGRASYDEDDVVWFTDGSKTEEGSGSGIYGIRPEGSIVLSLGKYATVFQTEVGAISVCLEENLRMKYEGRNILIFTDSQAAIKALNSYKVKSKQVWHCLSLLTKLGQRNDVILTWVPGHSGIEGNEKADELARKGSETPLVGPEPVFGIPYGQARAVVKGWMEERKTRAWYGSNVSRLARKLIRPSKKLTEGLLSLNKENLRWVVGILTGHCQLRKHLHRIGVARSSRCRKCGLAEESSEHILLECEALGRSRMLSLGPPGQEIATILRNPIGSICSFLKGAGVARWD